MQKPVLATMFGKAHFDQYVTQRDDYLVLKYLFCNRPITPANKRERCLYLIATFCEIDDSCGRVGLYTGVLKVVHDSQQSRKNSGMLLFLQLWT